MTSREQIVRTAYARAWEDFERIPQTLPERRLAPQRLRQHILTVLDGGEHDPEKIAEEALGRLREAEQIARSRARVMKADGLSDAS
ncbi:MAG TPA: hypothetical protein VGM57_04235 [Pseudolabrys sp.]|jgi:hypothetical protein